MRATISTVLWLLAALSLSAAPLNDRAREFKTQLGEKILPYWFDTAQDTANGGYWLSDDLVKGRTLPKEKAIVTQARMIWMFSLAHRQGFSDARRDYLKAAAQGYRFLIEHFLDKEHGGYFWKTDLAGKSVKQHKFVYGEAFVIYALVEYHRASGDKEALRHAGKLYQTLQDRACDPNRCWDAGRLGSISTPTSTTRSNAATTASAAASTTAVSATNRPLTRRRCGGFRWKANYHDVRALVKFVEAFGAGQAR